MIGKLIRRSALNDIGLALAKWPLWTLMGWQDIKQRYRGSALGPFWVTGSIAAMALGIGVVYSKILATPIAEFLPYVTVGLAIWFFIVSSLTEGSAAFISAATMIRNSTLPLPIYVFRSMFRNVIIFAHHLVVIVAVFVVMRWPVHLTALWVIPAFLLLIVNLTWMSILLGILSARYRDVLQMVQYMMQFLVFLTPIFWYPRMAGQRHLVLVYNIFYHFLETVRAPLMGGMPSAENWAVSIWLAILGLIAAFLALEFMRKKIVFWV